MRTWLAQRLSTSPAVQALFGDRVFQSESILSGDMVKPFLFYAIGNSTDVALSEDTNDPERQFFQIYIHDEGGDYTRIDEGVRVVKQLLENASDPASGVITTVYLETSRDLDDQTMGTILRYVRFQSIISRS